METHGYYHDVNNYLPVSQQQPQQQPLQQQQPQQQPQPLQQPLQHNDGFLNQTQFYQQNQTQYNLQQQQQNSVLQQPQYYTGGHGTTTKLTDDTALRQQQLQQHKTIDPNSNTTSVSFNSSNLNVEINCNQFPNNNNTLNNNTSNNNIGGYPISNNSNSNSTNMLNPPYFYHYPHQKVQNSCDIPQSNTNNSNSTSSHQNSNSSSTAAPYYDAAYPKNASHTQQYSSVYPPPPAPHHYYHHSANHAGLTHSYTDLYNQSNRHASGHHNSMASHRGGTYYPTQQQSQYPMKAPSMPVTNNTTPNYGHYPSQTVRNTASHTENVYSDPRYNQFYANRQYPANYYPPQIIPPPPNQSNRTTHTNLPSSQELSRNRSMQRTIYSSNPPQTQQPVPPSQYTRNSVLYPSNIQTNNSVIKSTASEMMMMHENNQHHNYDDRYAAAASSVANVKYYNNCLYNGERPSYAPTGAPQSASCELNNLYQNYHHMRRTEMLPSYNNTANSYISSAHSDMYSLNSAKISSSQSNQSMHRSHPPSSDKFNFIDLEDQINCSKIMKSRDSYFGQFPYHPGDVADENAKSQNLRDFLATWNEEEDDEAKLGNSGYSTTHIEIGNRENKCKDSNKRDCDEDCNPTNNNNTTTLNNTTPRIHVGITVGNSNNNNNLPDIIIDIEKPKTHSGDDGSLSIVNNSEKLYVLESIDVPVADLSKYKHLSVVNKLPENIIHFSRANGEFGETIETSLKFIEEVEKNREKYYKNDFELNVEYESGKNSPLTDRKLLPASLGQFDDEFMYDYEVNKFLKDSLDMIEAEENNKNRILPKFEKFANDECIVIDDDEDEVKIKIEPKEEKFDYIPAKRRRIEKPAVEREPEPKPESVPSPVVSNSPPPPQFQPKSLKTICGEYMKTEEYIDFTTPKYNPKTLREICEQYIDETEITIMIPEPLSLREICENFVMSHREYFIVHEAYCEEPDDVPTLKALCEQVLDTNYYFEFDTSVQDEIVNDTNINTAIDTTIDDGNDDNNNSIQMENDDTFPATLMVPDAHDDDINEIIINDDGTTRKLIHDKLYLKYSKKLLYYQSNFKNMKKILKKYFVYFVRRRKISIETFLASCNKTVDDSLTDATSSYSTNSNSSSNNNNDTSTDDGEMMAILSADESHVIAKDDKKPNNDSNNSSSSNSSCNNNNNNISNNENSHRIYSPNIPKPHKKRKMNFDEILLNIDKYYSNSHNLNNHNTNNNNSSSNNNISPSNHHYPPHHHNHHQQHHHTKAKRDTSSSHHSSNNKKVSRLIIPRSKILDVDELKTIKENNVKLPYVRLERNIYIDKLARMQS